MPETFYTRGGDAVCRECFWRDQTVRAEEEADESHARADLPAALDLVAGVRLQAGTRAETPRKAFIAAAVLLPIGLGLAAALFVATGEVQLGALLIAGLGVLALLQGLRLRRAQKA